MTTSMRRVVSGVSSQKALLRPVVLRSFRGHHVSIHHLQPKVALTESRTHLSPCSRSFATHAPLSQSSHSNGRSEADSIAEELQQMYAETKDEFEIATESTEAHATYAAEDREAARNELAKLIAKWQQVLEQGGEVAEDLKKRPIGQRIRELSAAIDELNLKDYED